MTDLIWSFSPWFVFLLASRFVSFSGAVGLAFVAAIVVLVRAESKHNIHMLDIASLCYFLALAVILAAAHPAHIGNWSRYAQLGSHLALTLVVFGSILVGRPFTESYARQTTPRELWDTPQFRAVNRRISAAWGLAFVVGDVSLALAGSVSTRQVLLRVIVPFGALYGAYRYTESQRTQHETGPEAAGEHP
jgi:hypothetical protein